MDKTELIFRTLELLTQFTLVILAGIALFTWKRELRGKDSYKLARDLLSYIKQLRFLIFAKGGSMHQILLNDIFVNRKEFYKDQISLIRNEKIYFDQTIWGLFKHVDTRGDIFLPKNIRVMIDELCPKFGKKIDTKKNLYTLIQLQSVESPKFACVEADDDSIDGVYEMDTLKSSTIEEYFQKWEKLIIELQKII